MEHWLPESGVAYAWEPRLGGRRRAQPDSVHRSLRVDAFRGYADHMETEEFAAALDAVLAEAARRATTVMCAESLWWRCHRRLLADAATLLRGANVEHLFHDGRVVSHRPTDGVDVVDGRLVYDLGAARLPLEESPPGTTGDGRT